MPSPLGKLDADLIWIMKYISSPVRLADGMGTKLETNIIWQPICSYEVSKIYNDQHFSFVMNVTKP